jgi:hypothetical protein
MTVGYIGLKAKPLRESQLSSDISITMREPQSSFEFGQHHKRFRWHPSSRTVDHLNRDPSLVFSEPCFRRF